MLELVAEGLENKEIGHRIGLSEQAVKEHVSALLRRLAVRNRASLAEIATELKIAGTMLIPTEWEGFAELSAEQLALFDLVPSAIVAVDRHGAVRKTVSTSRRNDGPRSLPAEGWLARAPAGELGRDLRIRLFLPVRSRDALVRFDATPLGGRRRGPGRRRRDHRGRRLLGARSERATDRAPSRPSLAPGVSRP